MYPEDLAGGSSGSLGYKFPNTFTMEFFSNGTTIEGPKVDESYLEACSVAYNPTNQSILDNAGSGYFSEIDLNLTFTESRTLNRDKIGEGF